MTQTERFPRLQKRGPIEATKPAAGNARTRNRFHAYKSVAPLKLALKRSGSGMRPSFHAYKSVAPLKPLQYAREQTASTGFHAYKSVAPLKQSIRVLAARIANMFPRLQKRGPIEAQGATLDELCENLRFHAYKSVAPLKLR